VLQDCDFVVVVVVVVVFVVDIVAVVVVVVVVAGDGFQALTTTGQPGPAVQ
jgi:hypothetical protein